MMGAMAAGAAFGTAGTAAAHAIQYPVGTLTHTAHGLGVAALLPYVMAYNRPVCTPALAEIARTMGLGKPGLSDDVMAGAAIDGIAELFAAIGIPRTLADLGLQQDQQAWTAEQAIGIGRLIKNNPRALDLSSMQALVKSAFDGNRHSIASNLGQ
jgi:alcohol dehydrogenase class IV